MLFFLSFPRGSPFLAVTFSLNSEAGAAKDDAQQDNENRQANDDARLRGATMKPLFLIVTSLISFFLLQTQLCASRFQLSTPITMIMEEKEKAAAVQVVQETPPRHLIFLVTARKKEKNSSIFFYLFIYFFTCIHFSLFSSSLKQSSYQPSFYAILNIEQVFE